MDESSPEVLSFSPSLSSLANGSDAMSISLIGLAHVLGGLVGLLAAQDRAPADVWHQNVVVSDVR